jgi:hypothetical protein
MKRRVSPVHTLVVVGAALPFLAGAGTCGILYDLWSWDEITDHADRLHVEVTEGAVEIAAYPRNNIWIQRHVYAFERTIEVADYWVDEREVAQIVFQCDQRATCFADHWLEIPSGSPVEVEVGKGSVSLVALDASTTIAIGSGPVSGDALTAPSFELDGGRLGTVELEWTAAPMLVALTIEQGDVSLTVPAGTYACDITSANGEVEIDTSIVCEDGVDASLVITVTSGDVSIASVT